MEGPPLAHDDCPVRTLCGVWRSSGAGVRVQQDPLCDLDTKKGAHQCCQGAYGIHFGRKFEPQIMALALEVHFRASMKMQESAFRCFTEGLEGDRCVSQHL